MSEHEEQSLVIQWARLHEERYPELKLLHAIPNGAWFGGKWGTARKMLAEGLKKGMLDLDLPVVRPRPELFDVAHLWIPIYTGLRIEMKTERGRVSTDQQWWLDKLNEQGYKAVVCRGADEAIATIKEYLGIE